MAGGQEVAHGRIVIDLDDRATRDLERIDRDFQRTMKDIERERAVVDIRANVDDLDKDLRKAEKKRKDYEKKMADVQNAGAKANMQNRMNELRAEEKLARAQLTRARKERDAHKDETRAMRLARKEVDAITKLEEGRIKAIEDSHRRHMKTIREESRRLNSLHEQKLKIFRDDERQAHQIEKSRNAELAAIPKLQRRYAELERSLVKLAAARRKARGDEAARTVIDLREKETVHAMQQLHNRLKAVGQEPISINVELDRGARSGKFIRDAFDRGGVRHAASAVGIATGVSIGSGIDRGIRRTFSKGIIQDAFSGISRFGGRAVHVLEGLTNMTVRVGPFTATLRQLAVAMSLFAPILVDVIGALGSMVSVVGAATLGVGALSVGLAGGALPALIGVVTVLKPMIQQFKDVTALSKAYNKAVLQYGKGSDQAKGKLEQLNHALGSVDAQTREAFISAGTLSDRWAKLTEPSRAAAFHIMGRGLEFLNDNLGMFGRNTNSTFDAVQRSTDRWFKGLQSAEGRQILDTMWDNFNLALGPALDGLGNVAVYLGRIGAVASGFLPGLLGDFRNWSQGLADSASDADNLRKRIDGVMDATRSFGQFLLSGGRLLRTFFAGGVGPGVSMIDTMTRALERWNNTLQTTQGQARLGDFFERSVSGAQALYGALAPLISTFLAWASALSPVSAAFFNVIGAIASVIGAISRLTVMQGPLAALGATLATLWAVGKISAAATAVSNFSAALFGLSRAQAAVAVTSTAATAATSRVAATGAVAQGAFAATGAAAAKSGRQVGILRGAAQTLIPSIAGMGAVAGGAATAGLTILAGAAAYGVYKLATARTEGEKLRDELGALTDQSQAAGRAFDASGSQLGNVGGAAQRAALNLKFARQRLNDAKKGTDEYKLALLDYRDAQRYAVDAQEQWNKTTENYLKSGRDRNRLDEKRKELAKEIAREEKRVNDETLRGRLGKRDPAKLAEQKANLAALRAEYERLAAQQERAANSQAAAALNIKRGYQGLAPVLGQAQQQLGQLARSSRGLAARISVKFDAPKDVGRVAANASRALRAGIPARVVTRIVANSKDAEQAIKRIQALVVSPKEVRILQRGGERAVAMIERIKGSKLTQKQQNIAEKGGAGVIAMLERIIRRKIGNKDFNINAHDNATGIIGSIKNAVSGLVDKTINITTRYSTIGGPGAGSHQRGAEGAVASFADGGTGSSPDQNRIERAAAQAAKRNVRDITSGGTVTRPTYLTGEENRKEIIISTNPAYRKRNMGLLQVAARGLGTNVISAATGFEGGAYYAPPTLVKAGMPTAGGRQLGNKRISKLAKKKKGRNKIYARQDNWSGYIKGLHNQQEEWERETSIREQAVIEPESFIKETSRIPGTTLPDGTKTDDIVTYDIDTSVIAQFQAQLQAVKNGYDHLVQITTQLTNTLPRALHAADNEWRVRSLNADRFEDAMRRHRRLAKATKDEDVKRHHEKKADQAERNMQRERGEMKTLRELEGQYKEDRKEAGFDTREFRLSSEDYGRQIGAVQGRAAEEEAQAEGTAGGGAGAGGGATPATPIGVQTTLANEAKLEVLKEFAGNFAAIGGSGTLGGAGTLANLATNPALAGAAIGGAIVGSGGSLGAAGTSLVSGGTAAAREVAQPTATGTTGGTTAGAPSGGETTVSVTNNFQEPPADPHTWSSNTAFELGALMS